jgi:hypothetical protein
VQEYNALLASMTIEGMGPSLAVKGATTAGVLEAYIKEVLLPNLRAGQIVVMDNLGAHIPKRIRDLIEGRGCELIYLPAPTPQTTQPHRGGLQQDKGPPSPGCG